MTKILFHEKNNKIKIKIVGMLYIRQTYTQSIHTTINNLYSDANLFKCG